MVALLDAPVPHTEQWMSSGELDGSSSPPASVGSLAVGDAGEPTNDQFVGRERELGLLAARLSEPGLTVVRGERGIGKSRLVHELAGRHDGTVVWGRCWEAGPRGAYLPWIQIGAQLASIVELPQLAFANWLAPTFPHLDAADTARDAELLAIAWSELLQAVADRAAGTVIVIEDLHRADAESLSLLRAVAGAAIPIVATVRSEHSASALVDAALGAVDQLAQHVTLAGIADDAAGSLLDELVALPAAERITAIALGAGNPLRLRDLAAAYVSSGRFTDHVEMLGDRLVGVSAEAGAHLDAASVLGDTVDVATLAATTGRDRAATADALEELVDRGVIERVERDRHYRFAHDAYRHATYDGLGAQRRAELHAAAYEALVRDEPTEPDPIAALAGHAAMATPVLGSVPGVRWSVAAGEAALGSAAPATAERYFERALDLLDADSVAQFRPRVLVGLGRARTLNGRTDGAGLLDEAVDGAIAEADSSALAEAALAGMPAVGMLGLAVDPDERLVARLRRAHHHLPAQSHERARVAVALAVLDFTREGLDGLARLVAEVEAAADRYDDDRLAAWALVAAHSGRRVPGVGDALVADIERAIARTGANFDELHLSLWSTRLVILWRLGRFGDVARAVDRMHRLVDDVPGLMAWTLLRSRTTLAMVEGRFDAAEATINEGFELGTQLGHGPRAEQFLLLQLAMLQRDRGDDPADVARASVADRPENPFIRALAAWGLADHGHDDDAIRLVEGIPNDIFDNAQFNLLSTAVAAAMFVSGWTSLTHVATRALDVMMPFRHEWVVLGTGLAVIGPYAIPMGVAASGAGDDALAEELLLQGRQIALDANAPAAAAHGALELARHFRRRGEDAAAEWFAVASGEFGALGLDRRRAHCHAAAADSSLTGRADPVEAWQWALDAEAAPTVDSPPLDTAPSTATAQMVELERGWRVDFDGLDIVVPARKGWQVIAELLARPNVAVDVLELSAALDGRRPDTVTFDEALAGAQSDGAGADVVLDETALRAYRERIRELQATIDDAELAHDEVRSASARAELDAIADELERSTGLGGRSRRFSSTSERARTRVTKAVRNAIAAVGGDHPALAAHLEVAIRTGAECAYRPDPGRAPTWRIERRNRENGATS